MATITEQQANKLLDDISAIKSIINNNKPVIKQILLPEHFRAVSLFSGIAVIVLSAVYYYLIQLHGSYAGIPEAIRIFLLVFIVVGYILLAILKRILWLRSMKRINEFASLRQAALDLYRAHLIHVIVPHFILMFILAAVLYMQDATYYLVPLISIGLGIFYNLIGSHAQIKAYLVAGYWFIVTGIFPFIWSSVSPLIYLSISLGLGLLIFAAICKSSDSN